MTVKVFIYSRMEFAGETEAGQALEQAKRGYRGQGSLVGIP
jgi:hypothetical protein